MGSESDAPDEELPFRKGMVIYKSMKMDFLI
jgi:hypothetical protein